MSTQTTSPASLLANPHPCRHIVYPYTDEQKAVNAVCLFASSGISKNESVVLIMADSHCDPIRGLLAKAGLVLDSLQASGQLKCLSAETMLETLMAGGSLDEKVFRYTLNYVIDAATVASPTGKVRVFGEMVSLLLARKDAASAERMEELWNDVIEQLSISLFCTYKLLNSEYNGFPNSLANLHTHSIDSLDFVQWRSTASRQSVGSHSEST